MKKNLGLLLLGIYLVIHGLTHLVNFSFSGLDTVMAVLAIVAGALVIVGR
jgi:hypothetical protein